MSYVSKEEQKTDMRSTAYSFTLVGSIGILFLILLAAGVLPFQIASHTKTMLSIVMGIVFVIFLGIGIRSFSLLHSLASQAVSENQLYQDTVDWFCSTYDSAAIDSLCDMTDLSDDARDESLYFIRYEKMKSLLLEQYPTLSEDFLDHIIDELYATIFK
jgi:hypothetical protein